MLRQDASTGMVVDDGILVVESKNTFLLKVYSPFKTYFEGRVISVSAVSETGEFDILASHHKFITLLLPCLMRIKTEQKRDEVIKINKGLMHVNTDITTVYLDI
jgi:F0F1-type ATP synthase epsilon subunit